MNDRLTLIPEFEPKSEPGRELPASRITHRITLGDALDELTLEFSEPIRGVDLAELAAALTHRAFRQRVVVSTPGAFTYEEWQKARMAFEQGYKQETGGAQ